MINMIVNSSQDKDVIMYIIDVNTLFTKVLIIYYVCM